MPKLRFWNEHRNKQIVKAKLEGQSFPTIADEFNLSTTQVRRIFIEMTTNERLTHSKRRGWKEVKDFAQRASGIPDMTFEQFKDWIESSPDWRNEIIMVSGCPQVVRNTENFAKRNGVSTDK